MENDLAKLVTDRESQRLFYSMFPDEDMIWDQTANFHFEPGKMVYARDKYQKHLEFFRVGALYRERCFMAANKVSKTFGGGGYETTCHLTGLYPDWWEGRRFDHPTRFWAAGKTNETTRDIIQIQTLLGKTKYVGGQRMVSGTGLVPGHLIGKLTWKSSTNFVDTAEIKHVSGGWSLLGLKSYEQKRGSFEGTAQHGIWLDEEPDVGIYGECLIRTATTNGIIILTFTPLEGMSEVVMQFMPQDMVPGA